jgi:hypothetical protein
MVVSFPGFSWVGKPVRQQARPTVRRLESAQFVGNGSAGDFAVNCALGSPLNL